MAGYTWATAASSFRSALQYPSCLQQVRRVESLGEMVEVIAQRGDRPVGLRGSGQVARQAGGSAKLGRPHLGFPDA